MIATMIVRIEERIPRAAATVLGGGNLGKSGGWGLDARQFLHQRNAFTALGSTSERLIDFRYAAFLLLADAAHLTIGKAVAKANVHFATLQR
jgi:hypothetical protein